MGSNDAQTTLKWRSNDAGDILQGIILVEFEYLKPSGLEFEYLKPSGVEFEYLKPFGLRFEYLKPLGLEFQYLKPWGSGMARWNKHMPYVCFYHSFTS